MATRENTAAIRKAEAGDCPAVQAIALAAYAVYVERMHSKPFPMLDDYAEHIRREAVYVLEADNAIHGYVVLQEGGNGALLLDNIAVHPQSQKAGYGRRLALFAEEQGRKRGCVRICLYTNEAMVENLSWYQRLGYVVTHRAVEKGYRRVYMAKDL